MTDIQWICIWSDIGYQPGGHHVPYPGYIPDGTVLWQQGSSDPSIVIDPVLRTTLAQITTMDLPVEYKEIRTATYIAVLISDTEEPIYGWVRSIEEIAGRSPACRVQWEIDNWRTYFKSMQIRRGGILRRFPREGSGIATSSLVLNVRQGQYRTAQIAASVADYLDLQQTMTPDAAEIWKHTYWLVVRYVSTGTRTKIITAACPIETDITIALASVRVGPDSNPTNSKSTLKTSEIYQGLVDELIKEGTDPLNPENILVACITPFCPFEMSFRMTMAASERTVIFYPASADDPT